MKVITKPCKKCKTIERHPSGHCVYCKSLYNKRYLKKNYKKVIKSVLAWREKNSERHKAKSLQYRTVNRDKCVAATKDWRVNNLSHVRSYLDSRAEHIRDRDREYRSKYPELCRAKFHKRRVREKGAKPAWAVDFFIKEAFALAILRQRITGVPYSVDHIVPLRCKTASGLHTHTNLAVVPKILNTKKGARLIEIKPY